ncbi:hypothetical protein [Cutibacterium sp.]|uniref:hypothetical protein n=1 Tax=Cutibacterium sp. TaxID=1912221 RepID=UPI0026DC4719|nr:hypothetical protein [Cutibacterium sp.]MDO4412293.1 hypothetical protein [Cutibacterium sp.]
MTEAFSVVTGGVVVGEGVVAVVSLAAGVLVCVEVFPFEQPTIATTTAPAIAM